MKNLCLIIAFLLLFLRSYSQYFGGIEDGISFAGTGQTGINDQDLYCSGGPDDGFACNEIISAINNQENYCNGGIGDGYARVLRPGQPINIQVFYCSGGNDDGFHHSSITSHLFNSILCYSGGYDDGHSLLSTGEIPLFDQSYYLAGGSSDGFADDASGPLTLNDQLFYVSGGTDDGFYELYSGNMTVCNTAIYCMGGEDDGAFSVSLSPTYFAPGIWLGSVSSAWEDPANWSGNAVPGISIDVVIPPGKPRYPLIQSGMLTINYVQGAHMCKSLYIQEGGSLINRSDLFIYGDMNVSGLYQGDDNSENHVYLFPGGNLKVSALGQMVVGGE